MAVSQTSPKRTPRRMLTISAVPRELGVACSTVYRWLAAGLLSKTRRGLVNAATIARLKQRPRTGRPGGLTELERLYLVRDADALASPFLHGERGLVIFAAVARKVAQTHCASPQGRATLRALLAELYARAAKPV